MRAIVAGKGPEITYRELLGPVEAGLPAQAHRSRRDPAEPGTAQDRQAQADERERPARSGRSRWGRGKLQLIASIAQNSLVDGGGADNFATPAIPKPMSPFDKLPDHSFLLLRRGPGGEPAIASPMSEAPPLLTIEASGCPSCRASCAMNPAGSRTVLP